MSRLLEKTAEALAAYTDKKLAVGVSGGRDSMCLLHAVLHCGAVKKENITVVHVNHCLREQADGDEAFVREYCEKNGVQFVAKRVDVNKHALNNGLTIEQAARNLRYDVFFDLIKHGKADVILTAHHALDNAESVLMHLFRGAGLDGVRGMRENRNTVRPFIDIYPDELDEYVRVNNIKFVVDSTNFIDDADRNFIRLNVIPMIEQRYRGAVRAVNSFARECGSVSDYLDGAIDESCITHDDGAVLIAERALLSGVLATRCVRKALSEFSLVDITRGQIERVVELAKMRTGAVVELTGGILAAKEYGRVALYIPRIKFHGEVPIKVGANFIDGLAVDITTELETLKTGSRFVDLSKLEGAVLRFRRDGDMFTPGGGCRKKLKQFFIDSKIPNRKRDRIPLICRGSEVLVIVGLQGADNVRVNKKNWDKTKNIVTVTPRW